MEMSMKDFRNGTASQHSLHANGVNGDIGNTSRPTHSANDKGQQSLAKSLANIGRFTGKVVLLTGKEPVENASLVRRFAQLGTDVVIAYRADLCDETAVARQITDIKATVEAAGRHCLFLPVRVPAVQSSQQLVQQIVATFGRLDFFISRPTFAQTEDGRLLPQIQLIKAAMQAIK
jgi:hypothetical protein